MEVSSKFSSLDIVLPSSVKENGGENTRHTREKTGRARSKSRKIKVPSIEPTVISESSKEEENSELVEKITKLTSDGKHSSINRKDTGEHSFSTPPRTSSTGERSSNGISTKSTTPSNKQIKSYDSFKPRTPRLDEFLACQNPDGDHTTRKPFNNRSCSSSITQKVENIRCPKTGRLKPKPKPYVTRVHKEFVMNYVLQRQVDEDEDREFWESLELTPSSSTRKTRPSQTTSNAESEDKVPTSSNRNSLHLSTQKMPLPMRSRRNSRRFESIRDLIPLEEHTTGRNTGTSS